MGPEATSKFFQYLIELTPAENDQEHLKVVMVSDPTLPDRSAFLAGAGPSPVPGLVQAASTLEKAGADFIVIPCNTAHCFWDDLCAAVKIPVLSIVEETVSAMHRDLPQPPEPGAWAAGIIATRGTVSRQLYQSPLESRGIGSLVPGEFLQERVQEAIHLLKARRNLEEASARIQEAVTDLEKRGARQLLFGCTELCLVLDRIVCRSKIFDSNYCLAQAAVSYSLKERSQPAASAAFGSGMAR